jgi:pheromone shutdown protein TraB
VTESSSQATLEIGSETMEPGQDQPTREVHRDGVHYTLLGTAHVSPASVRAVEQMVADLDWDAVAVELCPTRLEALDGKKSWQDLDLFQIIRSGKAGLVMANLALSGYQKRIAEQFGIEPGAELKAAAQGARERGLPLQLVDRDLATTLRRTYRAVPWYKRFYLTTGLVMSSFSSEEIDEEAIEKLKEGDILESTFTEFAEQSPELYDALIAERDRYMAARLREENADRAGNRVLVVVGAGHLDGLAGRNSRQKPAGPGSSPGSSRPSYSRGSTSASAGVPNSAGSWWGSGSSSTAGSLPSGRRSPVDIPSPSSAPCSPRP